MKKKKKETDVWKNVMQMDGPTKKGGRRLRPTDKKEETKHGGSKSPSPSSSFTFLSCLSPVNEEGKENVRSFLELWVSLSFIPLFRYEQVPSSISSYI